MEHRTHGISRLYTDDELTALYRRWFSYDKRTGALTWRISPNARVRKGAIAGARVPFGKKTAIMVTFDRHQILAHRLIPHLVQGHPPAGDIVAENGDLTDLRWDNLMPRSRQLSKDPANIRRRQRARTRRMLDNDSDAAQKAFHALKDSGFYNYDGHEPQYPGEDAPQPLSRRALRRQVRDRLKTIEAEQKKDHE